MAASNKRKAAASPAPKPRRFGDKIALHHCNDEKKLSRKRASRTIAEGKAKFLGRKRKVSSPGQKENQCAVALITKNAVNPFVCGDEQSATESSVSFGDKELQLPEVRMEGLQKCFVTGGGGVSIAAIYVPDLGCALCLQYEIIDIATGNVGHLTALRCQPRLTDERVDIEIYVKRHEKLEKEEKQILRRDRIWQNEIRRRSRLLRIQQTPPRFRDFRIVVLRKLTRNFK